MKLMVKMTGALSPPGFRPSTHVYRGREGWTLPLMRDLIYFVDIDPSLNTYIPNSTTNSQRMNPRIYILHILA